MKERISEQEAEQLSKAVGLSDLEWNHLRKLLGRTPTVSEIQMIGVMWSEHCSYKSSKMHLKKLMTKGRYVVQGPGENAGLIELDSKRGLAFKIESHNHPSFVEPFQGAATGVGGILRDIFTMGARPIALGNYLRFGELSNEKHQHLLEGVVSGIAHYGNCMGIPVTAGSVSSHSCYNGNILVNVFCMGLVDKDKIYRSNSAKSGQSIMVWGARTGRDGIHGASLLASADFETGKTESTEQKIRVQVGDPFKEKVLMEATLEVMRDLKDDLAAIQDMGAAGLTSSTTEMAYRSEVGMRIDLNRVPVRETGMTAYELLLSESQERMLAMVTKGSEEKFRKVLAKWGCEAEVIGETDDSKHLRMNFNGEEVVDLVISDFMDAPPPELPQAVWTPAELPARIPDDVKKEWEVLERLMGIPSVASKKSIYQRYDTTVGQATVFGPGHESSVLWVPSEENPHLGVAFKGVADENYYAVNPRFGAQAAMLKAIRGLACVGARARAYTDGVNVGNPKTPHVQAALQMMVEGFNSVAESFETPCISGNVSMYNKTTSEKGSVDIFPTNFVVMVGVLDDVRKAVPSVFQKEGSEIWLLEIPQNIDTYPHGSLYAQEFWPEELKRAAHPKFDLQGEKRLQEALIAGCNRELFLSAKDVGLGGLAVSLAKGCLGEKILGFDGDLSKTQSRRDQVLFGETLGRVLVEVAPARRAELMKLGVEFSLSIKKIGQTTSENIFRIRPTLSGTVQSLYEKWSKAFS